MFSRPLRTSRGIDHGSGTYSTNPRYDRRPRYGRRQEYGMDPMRNDTPVLSGAPVDALLFEARLNGRVERGGSAMRYNPSPFDPQPPAQAGRCSADLFERRAASITDPAPTVRTQGTVGVQGTVGPKNTAWIQRGMTPRTYQGRRLTRFSSRRG